MMLTNSLTFARFIGSEGEGSRCGVSGKYSSRNSRIGIDCRITTCSPEVVVTLRVGTLADGLWDVYVGADCSLERRWM